MPVNLGQLMPKSMKHNLRFTAVLIWMNLGEDNDILFIRKFAVLEVLRFIELWLRQRFKIGYHVLNSVLIPRLISGYQVALFLVIQKYFVNNIFK